MTARCKVVAVTHASNVTGALTDLAGIVAGGPGGRGAGAGRRRAARARSARCACAWRRCLRDLRPQDVRPDRRRRAGSRATCWPSCRRFWAAARSTGLLSPGPNTRARASLRGRHPGDRRGDRHGRGRPLPRQPRLAGRDSARARADRAPARWPEPDPAVRVIGPAGLQGGSAWSRSRPRARTPTTSAICWAPRHLSARRPSLRAAADGPVRRGRHCAGEPRSLQQCRRHRRAAAMDEALAILR